MRGTAWKTWIQRRFPVILIFAVAAVFLGSLLQWNHHRNIPASRVDFAMNTVVEYRFYNGQGEKAIEASAQELSRLEHLLSATWQGSELEQLSQHAGKEPVTVSADTLSVLTVASEVFSKTDGLFDVTIGPICRLWNITGSSPVVPEQSELEQLLSLVGPQPELNQAQSTAFLPLSGQQLDFGGIAKGYACDRLREICLENQITDGYLSLGGNMMVLEHPYPFGIRDPQGGEEAWFATLTLSDTTMATAGGYERYFEQDGVRYTHILSPKTGYPPETDLLSVSVISREGALADALSTALYLMGREQALSCLEQFPQVQAVLVDADGLVWLWGEPTDFQLRENAVYRMGN